MTLLDILKIIDVDTVVAIHVHGAGIVYDEHMGNVGNLPLRLLIKYMTHRVEAVTTDKRGKLTIHIKSWLNV